MIKIILVLVFSSILYFIIIKPLRLIINEHIILPIFNFLLFNCDVTIPKPDYTELLIKSLSNNSKVLFRMPFNGFYIVPSVLMIVENEIVKLKIYTFIHLCIIIIPLLIFLIGINLTILLNGEFAQMLSIFASLVFTVLLLSQKQTKTIKI